MKIKGIKRLDIYMWQKFIPLLLMTFFICWFIVLLQFLWRYIDEMVGKGLEVSVLAQLMFYSAMSLIPMALPLGILLASLMTFGNLGEKLELLAMKSAGVPLHRIMMPLFVAVMGLATALFIFQNDYMITSQVKMWTILYSARRAKPELEIPEGTFYSGIGGFNIYVKQKNHETGNLKDVMIYDHSQGFDKMRVINADSGKLVMDSGKSFLTFSLYGGQSYENLESQEYEPEGKPIPYVKEKFGRKDIIIPFDAEFKMIDEGEMSSLHVGKNLWELNTYLDSVILVRDSVRAVNTEAIVRQESAMRYSAEMPLPADTSATAIRYRNRVNQAASRMVYRLDSLRNDVTLQDSIQAVGRAISETDAQLSELTTRKFVQENEDSQYRFNASEKHRKFTFPVACIVFFFIGAPLGAIIRKGGIGTPVVASVILFIIYYMIDTFGYKMAKAGDLEVWQGMWLSTTVLFPIGFFLTYKATRDSATLNLDSWNIWFKKLIGKRPARRVAFKELIVEPATMEVSIQRVTHLHLHADELLKSPLMKKPFVQLLWAGNGNNAPAPLVAELEETVEYLRNSTNTLVILKLMDYPIVPPKLSLWIPKKKKWGMVLSALLPLSLPVLLYLWHKRKQLKKELHAVIHQSNLILDILQDEQNKTAGETV